MKALVFKSKLGIASTAGGPNAADNTRFPSLSPLQSYYFCDSKGTNVSPATNSPPLDW